MATSRGNSRGEDFRSVDLVCKLFRILSLRILLLLRLFSFNNVCFFLFFYLFGVLTRVSEGAQIIFREILIERFPHQPRLFVRNVSEDFERERIISDFFILWNLS